MIRDQLLASLAVKTENLSIRREELTDGFDLVKSGLLNSLEFVEMLSHLEKLNQVEIDYEKALENNDLTTIGGIIRTFKEYGIG